MRKKYTKSSVFNESVYDVKKIFLPLREDVSARNGTVFF
jgi:hypothetical protein